MHQIQEQEKWTENSSEIGAQLKGNLASHTESLLLWTHSLRLKDKSEKGLSQQQLKQYSSTFSAHQPIWDLQNIFEAPFPTPLLPLRVCGALSCAIMDSVLTATMLHSLFPHGLQGVADARHGWRCLSMWVTSPQAVATGTCPESCNYCG